MTITIPDNRTIPLEAKAGGGFQSVGVGGGGGGGASALSWSAPSGLDDQNELILTTDTHTFIAPDKSVWLGFGEGWLYSQTDGTAMAQSVTVGSEVIEYEYGIGSEERFVQTENGRKIIRFTAFPSGAAVAGAGTLSWDTGAAMSPGDVPIAYRRARCTDGTVSNAKFQWKQERLRFNGSLSGADNNSAYVAETTPGGTGKRIVAYYGDGDAQSLFGPVPTHGEGFTDFLWAWKQNTPDESDGETVLAAVAEGDSSTTISRNPTNSGSHVIDNLIMSSSSNRPRFFQLQDFIGNNDNNTQDIFLDVEEIYWQLNGNCFFLADAPTIAESTSFIPLRVNSMPNSQEARLRLWSGHVGAYTGRYVILTDSLMNEIDSVELT